MVDSTKQCNFYLYEASLDDIYTMIECIESFKELNIGLRYTGRENFYSDTIKLCQDELKKLVKIHELEYDDKVDLRSMTTKIKTIIKKRRNLWK